MDDLKMVSHNEKIREYVGEIYAKTGYSVDETDPLVHLLVDVNERHKELTAQHASLKQALDELQKAVDELQQALDECLKKDAQYKEDGMELEQELKEVVNGLISNIKMTMIMVGVCICLMLCLVVFVSQM